MPKGVITAQELEAYAASVTEWLDDNFVDMQNVYDFRGMYKKYHEGVYHIGDYVYKEDIIPGSYPAKYRTHFYICNVEESSRTFVAEEWDKAPYNSLFAGLFYRVNHIVNQWTGEEGTLDSKITEIRLSLLNLYFNTVSSEYFISVPEYNPLVKYYGGDIFMHNKQLCQVVKPIAVGASISDKIVVVPIGQVISRKLYDSLYPLFDLIELKDTDNSIVQGKLYVYPYENNVRIFRARFDQDKQAEQSWLSYIPSVLVAESMYTMTNKVYTREFMTTQEYIESDISDLAVSVILTDAENYDVKVTLEPGEYGTGSLHIVPISQSSIKVINASEYETIYPEDPDGIYYVKSEGKLYTYDEISAYLQTQQSVTNLVTALTTFIQDNAELIAEVRELIRR